MAETKTKLRGASVEAHLASRASPEQLAHTPTGTRVATQARHVSRVSQSAAELVVYVISETTEQVDLLAKLGRHKMGKVCLYFKRLADLDAGSVAEVRRRYPHRENA